MATFNFRTYTQSTGPESFDGGVVALDVIQIPWAEVTSTFSAIATGDTLNIRQKSGLRQYVPELCYVYWDNHFTAGQVALVIDGVQVVTGSAFGTTTAGRATAGGSSQVATPTNAAFSTATTGGSLVPATYYYRVAARDAVGTTLASTETSQVVPAGTNTNTVTVNWGPVAGATGGYDIFGRSTGAELLIGHVAQGVTTFVDDGSVTPAGALPGANTTLILNSVYGTELSTPTADTGSVVALYMTTLPVGSTGNLYIQIATRPAQG